MRKGEGRGDTSFLFSANWGRLFHQVSTVAKIDLPPLLREELETRFHSVRRSRDSGLVNEIKKALGKSGDSDLSEGAINLIREEVKEAITMIEKDKYLSKDPHISYHKDALKYALNNVLLARACENLSAAISAATRK